MISHKNWYLARIINQMAPEREVIFPVYTWAFKETQGNSLTNYPIGANKGTTIRPVYAEQHRRATQCHHELKAVIMSFNNLEHYAAGHSTSLPSFPSLLLIRDTLDQRNTPNLTHINTSIVKNFNHWYQRGAVTEIDRDSWFPVQRSWMDDIWPTAQQWKAVSQWNSGRLIWVPDEVQQGVCRGHDGSSSQPVALHLRTRARLDDDNQDDAHHHRDEGGPQVVRDCEDSHTTAGLGLHGWQPRH